MDKKMLDVMRKILSFPSKVTELVGDSNEYYFRFDKYAFSIARFTGAGTRERADYVFYLYPRWTGSIANLKDGFERGEFDSDEVPMYALRSNESEPFLNLFSDLFKLMQGKSLNLDGVFKDLLG